MSRDQGSLLPITCQGSILTLRHVGVIRNQRSKIHRSNITTTAGALIENAQSSSVE